MQDMQDMIDRLNQSGKRLSKGHRKIAQYIVEHYDKAVFMTASRLGESVGVSESTVVRFAAAMGYEGYPQLQRSLQELVSHRLTANQRFEMATELDPSAALTTVLKSDMQNLLNLFQGVRRGSAAAAERQCRVCHGLAVSGPAGAVHGVLSELYF